MMNQKVDVAKNKVAGKIKQRDEFEAELRLLPNEIARQEFKLAELLLDGAKETGVTAQRSDVDRLKRRCSDLPLMLQVITTRLESAADELITAMAEQLEAECVPLRAKADELFQTAQGMTKQVQLGKVSPTDYAHVVAELEQAQAARNNAEQKKTNLLNRPRAALVQALVKGEAIERFL